MIHKPETFYKTKKRGQIKEALKPLSQPEKPIDTSWLWKDIVLITLIMAIYIVIKVILHQQ